MMENQQSSKVVGIDEINFVGQLEIRELEKQRKSQPFCTRSVKVDFSKFEGENVLQWIFQAKRFSNIMVLLMQTDWK